MALEILIICVLIYGLVSPIADALADEIREKARKLELDNNDREYKTHYEHNTVD